MLPRPATIRWSSRPSIVTTVPSPVRRYVCNGNWKRSGSFAVADLSHPTAENLSGSYITLRPADDFDLTPDGRKRLVEVQDSQSHGSILNLYAKSSGGVGDGASDADGAG